MTVFDVMSMGHIVYRHAGAGIVVTWKGNATYNVWAEQRNGRYSEVDCFTVYRDRKGNPHKSRNSAEHAASEWARNAGIE